LFIFSLALFASAFLLLLVQPMVGKMVTPLLGGTPAVWNTCMVFFQALLLAGYAYAHVLTTRFRPRTQTVVHLAVLLAPLLFFPLAIDQGSVTGDRAPVIAVLLLLTTSVGIPFFVVSTSAPLLQSWFAGTDHPAAKDPYFLYAASNAGSMLALLGYPTIVEPWLRLGTQRQLWCFGYCGLALLIGACAFIRWSTGGSRPESKPPSVRTGWEESPEAGVGPAPPGAGAITWRRRLRWLALAAVPSSLTLAATTYVSMDIAAIPLLWVVPLALYLLSFILVFARRRVIPHRWMVLALPPLSMLLLFFLLSGLRTDAIAAIIALHLTTLFVAAMVCHGELAADRPPPALLTEFFLWMSLGGMLGGAFNALIAPVVFNTVAEYYVALFAACLLMPLDVPLVPRATRAGFALATVLVTTGVLLIGFQLAQHRFEADALSRAPVMTIVLLLSFGAWLANRHLRRAGGSAAAWLDVALPVSLGLFTIALSPAVAGSLVASRLDHVSERLGIDQVTVAALVEYGVPVAICCALVIWTPCFRAGVCALLFASWLSWSVEFRPDEVLARRGFFGVVRVDVGGVTAPDGEARLMQLMHGSTIHGQQLRDRVDPSRDARLRKLPLTYYHPSGPVGCIFNAYGTPDRAIGVIGLGTGSIAAYARPGQRIVFYEIDPLVRDVCVGRDSLFTFAADAHARGAGVEFKLGDARLVLEREPLAPAEHYGLLFVDAFSSDAIPVHLLTREAIRLYMDRLREDGILCIHVSNRFLNLRPVTANIAAAEGLSGLFLYHSERRHGLRFASAWVALARRPEYLSRLPNKALVEPIRTALAVATGPGAGLLLSAGEPLEPDPSVGLWSDDYCDLLSVLSWFHPASQRPRGPD
jgi:hypothetical protein